MVKREGERHAVSFRAPFPRIFADRVAFRLPLSTRTQNYARSGVHLDHSTINRGYQYAHLSKKFSTAASGPLGHWRMDETNIRVNVDGVSVPCGG